MGSITSTAPSPSSRLCHPVKLGSMTLNHRIAMAPLSRYRASDSHVPTPLMVEYYAQRASAPGTLIVTEGTLMSPLQGGAAHTPGIYNRDQIDAWREITEAVHAKGSFVFSQLWALGRCADPEVAAREGFIPKTSSVSEEKKDVVEGKGGGYPKPQAMSREEIHQTVRDYVQAARNAMEAGFDGVEVHAANGYLVDQFIQDAVNQRTDEYGGSVENRSRFAVEVVDAVVAAVGAEKVAFRLSPFSTFGGIGMADPKPQYADVMRKVGRHQLAYLHLVEPRVSGVYDVETDETLAFAYEAWKGPVLVAGGHTPESARRLVDEEYPDRELVVAFGRRFIANPDLPFRIREGVELTPWDRETFYQGGNKGYTDYPFSKEFETRLGE